jgi:hypothetical protein
MIIIEAVKDQENNPVTSNNPQNLLIRQILQINRIQNIKQTASKK